MVSQGPRSSKARLMAAAAEEFSARGFDGARVDRIATRAGVNKAMVYYHFASKAALYRAILTDVFAALADHVDRVPQARRADHQLRAFIRAIAAGAAAHPHFPAMWLRELADGGRHIDASVIAPMGAILRALSDILEAGHASGRFRQAHPLVTQLSIVAPLIYFQASSEARARFGRLAPAHVPPVDRGAFVDHLEASTLASLGADAHHKARIKAARRTQRSSHPKTAPRNRPRKEQAR